MFKNLLVCSVALLCSSLECGKHKKVKKEQGAPRVYEQRIKCSPDMTINDFKNSIARKLNADQGQMAIVFGEQDIASKGTIKLKDLGITKENMPTIVVQPGIRKPRAKKTVKKNVLPTSVAVVKTAVQKDIEKFLND